MQLADSAFPVGAFAHSLGLETLKQLGYLRGEADVVMRVRELVWQTALGVTPFAASAWDDGANVVAVDRACEAFMANHVANRASRAQGAAFLLVGEAMYGAKIGEVRSQLPYQHVGPAMGAALARIGVALADVRELIVFGAARGALSAAVRLGAIGPMRAQALMVPMHAEIATALQDSEGWRAEDAVNVSPMIDSCQGMQDRLYTRLFQS